MADIIIKGMEIPTNRDVTITIGSDGVVYVHGTYPTLLLRAIPLPKGYGRLIDGDALYEVSKTRSMGIYGPCNYQCVITGNDILKAPTIVPAEGVGANGI